MGQRFLVAIVSKDDRFSITPEEHKAFLDSHPDSAVTTIPDNRERITVVGNRLIGDAMKNGFDYLVMMHADVHVDLCGLSDHISRCDGIYDVMGLCGCEKIVVSESPLNWFCGSRQFPEGRWGCVSHGELGDMVSYFSEDRADVTEHRVACIDGLCIVMSRKSMESGLRFDENLRFNCYDTQISFDAVMRHGLRLGCLVEKDLKHYSVGRSILKDDFLVDELVLRRRFGFDVPPQSKLKFLIDNETLK